MLRCLDCRDIAVKRIQNRSQFVPDLPEKPPIPGIFGHIGRSTDFGLTLRFHPFGDVLIHLGEAVPHLGGG